MKDEGLQATVISALAPEPDVIKTHIRCKCDNHS